MVIREKGEILKGGNGMGEVYVNIEIDDNSDVAVLMRVVSDGDAYDDICFPET